MKRAFKFLPLHILISLSLYAAESVEQKIDINQKNKSHFKLVPAYTYQTHAQQNENCYLMRLSSDGRTMMSVGYDDHDKKYYLRIHTTDNGQDIRQRDGKWTGHISATRVYDAAWSPDTAYVGYITKDKHTILPIQPPGAFGHVGISYRYGAKYFYNLITRTENGIGTVFITCYNKYTCLLNIKKQIKIRQNPTCNFPEQSCFLNHGHWVGIYTPNAHCFGILDIKTTQTVLTRDDVTAADLSKRTPIIGTASGEVCILNPQTGTAVTTIQAFTDKAVTAVALAPEYVAALSESNIRIFSRLTGTRLSEYAHEGAHRPRLLRFILAGVHAGNIAAYVAGKKLITFNATTAKKLRTIALDSQPHSMISHQTGLYVGTALSITRFAPKEVTDKKEPVTNKDIQDKV